MYDWCEGSSALNTTEYTTESWTDDITGKRFERYKLVMCPSAYVEVELVDKVLLLI